MLDGGLLGSPAAGPQPRRSTPRTACRSPFSCDDALRDRRVDSPEWRCPIGLDEFFSTGGQEIPGARRIRNLLGVCPPGIRVHVGRHHVFSSLARESQGAPNGNADLIEEILKDQAEIKSLFAEVEASSGKESQRAFQAHRRKLVVHETAEQELIHPLLKAQEGGSDGASNRRRAAGRADACRASSDGDRRRSLRR